MKRKNLLFGTLFLMTLWVLVACGQRSAPPEVGTELTNLQEKAFLNHLAGLCGLSFEGQQLYMREGRESWEDKHFVMHVTVCEDDRVYVPFHLDDDHSRTWMFLVEEGRLRFRHDHRDPDGTPQRSTMYGGYSDGQGSEFVQYFPADDYTIDNRISSANSIWIVELAEDLSTFSYSLVAGETLIFKGEFDLTKPI